ncbi:MAG: TRAM domain-containing protein [Tissierellia bacterium]|nr:TRAM domain-containing protein [Tissierellia bacterium]
MVNKLVRILFFVLGFGIGFGVFTLIDNLLPNLFPNDGWQRIATLSSISILFGLILFSLNKVLTNQLLKLVIMVETELTGKPLTDLLVGSVGLIVGLVIAFLLSRPFADLGIPVVGTVVSVLLHAMFGYLGIRLSVGRRQDLITSMRDFGVKKSFPKEKVIFQFVPKVLDTSVIIDGRIADICRAGFIEGPLIIPTFVLEELQHIADSSDGLKRNRGRRGLDILRIMQQELPQEVIISQETFLEVPEVDSKLLKLTQKLEGKIVTIDYNLNKVATVQGLTVLNINDLANAVKQVAIPGEEMEITVVKEGKEAGQGLAYLDDGTMIVIENGRKLIDKTIEVVVTSVLQTSAGKMIFAKPKSDNN